MKKILVLVLIFVLSISCLFAKAGVFGKSSVNGYMGLNIGPAFAFGQKNFGDSSYKIYTNSLAVALDGATYFNKGKNQIGLGYGVHFDIPFSRKTDAGKVGRDDLSAKFGIAPKVSLQYKYVLDKEIELYSGVGASFAFYSLSEATVAGATMKTNLTVINILANVGMNYKPDEKVAVRAGFEFGIPMITNGKVKTTILGSTTSSSYDSNYSGVSIFPFVGLAFMY